MKFSIKTFVVAFIALHFLWFIYDMVAGAVLYENDSFYLIGYFLGSLFTLRSIWVGIIALVVAIAYGYFKRKQNS